MLPVQLATRRFPGGFKANNPPGVLIADERQAVPHNVALDLERPMFARLINSCRTDDDLRAFADRDWDQPVTHVGELRALAGRLSEAAKVSLDERFAEAADADGFGAHMINYLLGTERLSPRVRLIDGRMRLSLEANSTATFMAMEVAAAFEVGAQITACQHCHNVFLFGPLTGRRSHAQYCAVKCRVAAMRARNSKKDQR
jgi:hypothetical protein